MAQPGKETSEKGLDGLRMLGLGRIPLCADCPRYRQLRQAYRVSDRQQPRIHSLLAAPPGPCSVQYCAPLARRYTASASPARQPAFQDAPRVKSA